jgi:hypothetical protein
MYIYGHYKYTQQQKRLKKRKETKKEPSSGGATFELRSR